MKRLTVVTKDIGMPTGNSDNDPLRAVIRGSRRLAKLFGTDFIRKLGKPLSDPVRPVPTMGPEVSSPTGVVITRVRPQPRRYLRLMLLQPPREVWDFAMDADTFVEDPEENEPSADEDSDSDESFMQDDPAATTAAPG
ncbi:MAG: hypothetical protein KVP17_003365, partial [Porospora cf. gigantea B]|uniref:uncharacterized protein n=1 Tax=Porospora cf. gigantea B TaxID=2853592 RepID=UPI003571DE81